MNALLGRRARPALVGLIVLAALVPLLNPHLPRSADGRLHLFRAVELDWLVRNGIIYTRYAPDLAYGYGYPLLNFYAPLSYYGLVGLHWLGLNSVSALQLLSALAVLIGAWGLYALTAEWFGPVGAGLAAAVYAFGPYTLFNILARTALPEALGVALLPWLWWSLRQALARPTALTLLRLALLYATLIYTHNLTALLGTALSLIWLITEGAANRARVALALLSGLLLGGCFWLPALLEQNAVQITALTTPATLDFRNYFLSLSELLAPPYVFDPRLENQPVPVALGWPQAALALLGIVSLWRQPEAHTRLRLGVAAALFLLFVALNLRVTLPLWEAIGPLRLVQFPWRFLGPATLLAAVLAGAGMRALPLDARRWFGVLPALALAATALYALPWTYVLRYPAFPANPTLDDLFAYETESGSLGLTSTGEFLPMSVRQLPPADGLRARYAANPIIDRLDRESLPAGVRVITSRSELLSAEAAFTSNQPFEATFLWFAFPGWQAEVDGRRVDVGATEPHGFVSVPVPAGEHTVRVFFGTTPVRQWAAALSFAGVILLSVVVWRAGASRVVALREEKKPEPVGGAMLTLAALGLALGLARLWFDERDNPFRRSRFDGQTIVGVAEALDVNFGNTVNLIGADPPATAPADGALRFTLYWRLYDSTTEDYSVAAQLRDAAGHLVGQQDAWQMDGHPTSRWLPGNYAVTRFALTPYPGTPPGAYRLVLSVYPETGEPLNVLNLDGNPLGRELELDTVTLTEPMSPPTDAELAPALELNAALGPLTLIGADVPRAPLASGDMLPLVLYWRAPQAPFSELRANLEVVSVDGTVTPLGDFAPAREDYPTSAWPPGAAVRAPHSPVIPPSVPGGPAELRLSLVEQGGAPVSLGEIEITVPARTFDLPMIGSPLAARLGPGINLLGYRVSAEVVRSGESLQVTLYWQSVQPVAARYKVFVQLLDAERRLLAQADAVPGQGARPTTGWLPPEVITDPYTLTLPVDAPPGDYALEIGMYDPLTGARVEVLDDDAQALGDHVRLRSLSVSR